MPAQPSIARSPFRFISSTRVDTPQLSSSWVGFQSGCKTCNITLIANIDNLPDEIHEPVNDGASLYSRTRNIKDSMKDVIELFGSQLHVDLFLVLHED